MLSLSETATNTPEPSAQNWHASGSLTLYLAGEMSAHLGGMIQASYSVGSNHFKWNNTDIRYANRTTLGSKDLAYGLTLNNGPTVEDVWNSTPSWGYPWLSGKAPSPTAQPLIAGALAQDVRVLSARLRTFSLQLETLACDRLNRDEFKRDDPGGLGNLD